MTEEQEAIERLEYLRDDIRRNKIKVYELISEEGKYNLADDIETVLDTLKEKDKEIDLMSGYIATLDIEEDICMKNKTNPDWCNEDYTKCKECIKQYFKRKAQNES